jgi:hypothetical protein
MKSDISEVAIKTLLFLQAKINTLLESKHSDDDFGV